MRNMHKLLLTAAAAAALSAGPAFALQNVANTSQKGSLLVFPHITIDPEDGSDTFIEISNDQNKAVHVECFYVNEKKARVDFDFVLTKKQTVSWDVKTQDGDHVSPPEFPKDGTFTGAGFNVNGLSSYRGELVCFAVDFKVQNQIAFNHLTGTATVLKLNDDDARQKRQAFRYNAWSFVARGDDGSGARDFTRQGEPGRLELTGNGAGTYDACPAFNIANFMSNGATLGNLTTLDNDLAVVSCNQDLRQDFEINTTKLQFVVWNAKEHSFTGSWQCVDSVQFVGLSRGDNAFLVNPGNFDYFTLKTQNARFQVQGVASTQCPFSKKSGLLGVLTSSVSLPFIDPVDHDSHLVVNGEDQELGSTTFGRGAQIGLILWDPLGPVDQRPTRR